MHRALLVIDVQKAFDDATSWGRRNNPSCEANAAALIAGWDGVVLTADEPARTTAASLHGELATVVSTRDAVQPS